MVSTRMCPAIMLANKRNDKLAMRTKYDSNSTDSRNGANMNGILDGTKHEKKFTPCIYNPTNSMPIHEILARKSVTVI